MSKPSLQLVSSNTRLSVVTETWPPEINGVAHTISQMVMQIVTEGPLGYSAMKAAHKLDIPVISDFHTNFDQYSRYYRLSGLFSLAKRYLRHVHNQTLVTLVPTRELQQQLSTNGYTKLGILDRGIDVELFNPQRRNPALREQLGIQPDQLLVTLVSRMAQEKNLDLAFEAFRAIQQQVPEARFLLVGDGPERKRLQDTHPDCLFVGMQTGTALAEHYASGDLFLYPSTSETFGKYAMKLLHQLNDREIPLCLLFNRVNHLKQISLFFAAISRLGNGVFWYVLMLILPLIYGWQALQVSLHMALVGLAALLVYKWLKSSTERVRPYSHSNTILQNVAALDQFSFPSGHTLHAVGFSWVLLSYYPEWFVLVVPFSILVALSRVVLGLHYPSDVLMGAFLGAGLAQGSICLLSCLF